MEEEVHVMATTKIERKPISLQNHPCPNPKLHITEDG